jgi:hypothetical protein
MLEIERKMNAIKQLGKWDNVRQRPFNITQLSKNNYSKKTIKIIFGVDLHHAQSRCSLKRAQMPKRMATQPPKVDTPN